jgi:hypothetical protein
MFNPEHGSAVLNDETTLQSSKSVRARGSFYSLTVAYSSCKKVSAWSVSASLRVFCSFAHRSREANLKNQSFVFRAPNKKNITDPVQRKSISAVRRSATPHPLRSPRTLAKQPRKNPSPHRSHLFKNPKKIHKN